MSSHLLAPIASSIDVFLTYRCGLRCSHCFVGESLSLKLDLDFDLFVKLVNTARQWNTEEITFLGGEPTLYPQFLASVELAQGAGYRVRIVTNGQQSYSLFLDRFAGAQRPFICFSIDGSCPEVHDTIMGQGSFCRLLENVRRTKSLGYRASGIISVSRQNAHDVSSLLVLCDYLGFEYVNVHYVTNRGFAKPESVLTINEWERVYRGIVQSSCNLRLELRIEKTFYDGGAEIPLDCAVVQGKNLMFLPDGRVYMCMLFIDVPNSHSFTWTTEGLQVNPSSMSEQLLAREPRCGCPAMHHVNRAIAEHAEQRGRFIQCIYQKEHIQESVSGRSPQPASGLPSNLSPGSCWDRSRN